MKLNKKQKRTATIASMAALLAVVLGMGGQTFAKYIETHEVQPDQAVVAKWGYVITATGVHDTATETKSFSTSYNGDAIKATGSDNVVAPGATGGITATVTGTSEVKARLSIEVGNFTEVHLDQKYYPIIWTVEANDVEIYSGNSVTALKSAVSAWNDDAAKYPVFNAAEAANYKVELNWEWPFTSAVSTGVVDNEGDALDADDCDTLLGIAAKESPVTVTDSTGKTHSYNVNVAYEISVTLTQVQ